MTSMIELFSAVSISMIGLNENCCCGIDESSSGQRSTVEDDSRKISHSLFK
ncbi:hypothetical protein HanPSC8_Chr10g0449661 [Helianthus annuus]|nr:hypothetical protein HanPSC8_Chr10g0449661 [Helianthus annuus]